MKFQCGQCDKYYRLDDSKIPDKGIQIKCANCENRFAIRGDLRFRSESNDSKIQCSNCGKFLPESFTECDQCNLKLFKLKDELRIDNKYYEDLDIDDNGTVADGEEPPKKKRKAAVICSIGLVFIVAGVLGYTQYGHMLGDGGIEQSAISSVKKLITKEPDPIKKKIVILKSGQTLYADQVVKDGNYYRVTGSNGMQTDVNESDVLQIADAKVDK
jgi:predicted Zn finger-like uncharacterized protein